MTISTILPIFRQVLFRIPPIVKSKSGLIAPPSNFKLSKIGDFTEEETVQYDGTKIDSIKNMCGEYVAIKVAEDCINVKVGDTIILTGFVHPTAVVIDEEVYFSVSEQHIALVERKTKKDASIRATHPDKSKTTRSRKLQKG